MLYTSTLVTTKLYFNAGSSLDPVDPPVMVLCLHIGNLAHASHMYVHVHVHVCVLIILCGRFDSLARGFDQPIF